MAAHARFRGVIVYGIAATLAVVGAVVSHRLWLANLRDPLFPFSGEAPFTHALVKGLLENPWFFHNSSLGAPFGLDLRERPHFDILLWAWVQVARLFTRNHFLIENLLLLASYPLVTLVSLHVFRRLNVDDAIGIGASLIFAFSSFHALGVVRQPLFAIGYFTVPLAIELALSLFARESVLFDAPGHGRLTFVRSRQSWTVLAWCALIGGTGNVWFPLISGYLLLVAGVVAAIRLRSLLIAARSATMLAVIGLCYAVSLLPAILHGCTQGTIAALTSTRESGLQLAQLLLPGALRGIAKLPDAPARSEFSELAERAGVYLGVVASAGCCFLLSSFFLGGRQPKRIRALGVVNGAVLLLGMSGALSSLATIVPTPSSDGSRLTCVYVAFASLVAVASLTTRWLERESRTREQLVKPIVLGGALLFGLWDQRVILDVDYDALRTRSSEWRHFIKNVEHALPAKGAVFQFPNVPLPEVASVEKLEPFEQLMPYLHSKSLRWSYGTFGARRPGDFNAKIAAMPVEQAVDSLVLSGFSAVYVARKGYADRAAQLEGALKPLLGNPLAALRKDDVTIYSLLARQTKLRADLGEKEFERRRLELMTQLYWGWLEGCHLPDPRSGSRRVRCESKFRFAIDNPAPTAIHVVLEAKLHVAPAKTRVTFQSDVFDRDLRIDHAVRELSEGFDVPPGEHIVTVNVEGIGMEELDGREITVAFDDPHFSSIVR